MSTYAILLLGLLRMNQLGMNILRLRFNGAEGAWPNGELPTLKLIAFRFVFDSASNREKREIAKVFFAAASDRTQTQSGIEQWFTPGLGVSYESRRETHQLLAADMLAWTIATIRAREIFRTGRFVEVFWLAKIFVSTNHIRIGYTRKDTLAQWEKDRLDIAKTQD